MIEVLKLFFGSLFSKKSLEKTLIDSKLGKLICIYKKEDIYFTWDTEYKLNNNNSEPISISIDGDTNGPFSSTLQKTYQIMDSISELQSKIQTKIDLQFPEKNIDLKRDFNLEDLYIYLEEETNSVEYEFEYYSNDSEIMISVEFVNDDIEAIEFY
jgi:hypothetical protein